MSGVTWEEPVDRSFSLVLVMRNRVWLLLIAAATLLVPGVAAAKGSTLRFDEEEYTPGDRAVAHATVETWPAGAQPDDGPYTVYLVRGGQPLWFGHLPTGAVPVGELRIGQQVPDKTEVGDTYRVKVSFEVPQASEGLYSVWVCAPGKGGKGCWIGFGDLVYGQLIAATPVPGPAVSEPAFPDAAKLPKSGVLPASSGSLPLVGLAFALAVAAITGLLVRRHGRASA